MSTSKQILFRRTPSGFPTPDDFEIATATIGEPAHGQFLVRNLYLSLDPYMRMLMGGGWTFRGYQMTPGEVMVGRTLAVVTDSHHPDYGTGTHLVGNFGWQTHALSDGSDVDFRLDPKEGVPITAYLGACGSNGVTAWAGLEVIGEPKAGETVLVSAAAGSVGSAAGQIAKARGCTAIGVAGGEDKCRIAVEQLGFDACCDYKAGDLDEAIADAAPQGIDVYFDNVGGEMLDTVLALMNPLGRIPVCGVLSQYNAEGEPYGVRNTRLIFDKRLRLQGFLVSQFRDRWDEARAELESLVAGGRLRYRETIAEGIESAPEAFVGMLRGRNVGKQLVRLG